MFEDFCLVSKLHEKYPNFPFSLATLYKWHHLQKYPGLFHKFSGRLFIDLRKFDELLSGRSGDSKSSWLKSL